MGNTSKMLAMRRDGTVVPVTIKVSKLMEGADGQHQFIGVIRPLTEEETGGPDARMMVWLSPEMSVLCANGAFTSVTGARRRAPCHAPLLHWT